MRIIWIYVMRCVRLSSRPSIRPSFMAKLKCWISHANCGTQFFHTCRVYRHHSFVPFYATFTDLDLSLGSQDQRETKLVGFISSNTFYLNKIKFDVVMKQFKLNTLGLLLRLCWAQHGRLFTSCRAGLVELRSLHEHTGLFAQLM